MERSEELHDLMRLKARYCRLLDSKQWSSWQELFTEDLRVTLEWPEDYERENSLVVGRDKFVAGVTRSLTPCVTVHCVFGPEISLSGDREAEGIWAMFDWIDNRSAGHATQGFGHYHERYRLRDDNTWQISELRLTRIRVDVVPGKAILAG